MNRLYSCCLAVALVVYGDIAVADVFGSGANSFEIEFVTIGNPGNPSDTTGTPNPAGSVPYAYRIGKYEVSEQMIDKANNLGGLGITKVTRGPKKPATGINWFEAARFANWLNTSTGHAPAYKFDSAGMFRLWEPADPGYNPNNPFRNSQAWYFLPSVDEWYKAAYYDPAAGVYFDYPTGSNTVPDGIDFVGDPNFDAVFHDGSANPGPNDVTNVGVLSPYGTAGQGGNVAEWNESGLSMSGHLPDLTVRVIRGGDWGQFAFQLSSNGGNQVIPSSELGGLRVASIIPEPAASSLVTAGILILCGIRGWYSIERRHCHVKDIRWPKEFAR